MWRWMVLIALGFGVIISISFGEYAETGKEVRLELVEPQYEWVRPSADGTELCLGGSDYIKHQMYMEGLKHEARPYR